MGKKSISGRELANSFPEWSTARFNNESNVYRLLNSIGLPMDDMARQLARTRSNQYVPSANLDEVDQMYKVDLPANYSFSSNNNDPLVVQYSYPVVVGLHVTDTVSGEFTVSGVQSNTVQELWYETSPNRISLDTTVTGNHVLFNDTDTIVNGQNTFPSTNIPDLHLPRKLIVDIDTQNQQIVNTDTSTVQRGKIIIKGTTRVGMDTSETLVFPWSMKQVTLNEWSEIDRIEAYGFPSGVLIGIRSGDFNNGPYWDSYNLAYSEYRRKIDTFWDVGNVGSTFTLDKVGYISDDWRHLVVGIDDKEVKRSWETLNTNGDTVSGVDLAVQPFTTKAWVVDNNKQLYCYDLIEDISSDVSELKIKSTGPFVKLDFEAKHVVLNEQIKFIPFYERPLTEITRYRIWYKDPNGTKYGLLNGQTVAFSSDFWVRGSSYERNLEGVITKTANQRGTYVFVIEVVFADNETQTDVELVTVDYKTPLTQLDLSNIVVGNIDGIDFDSEQQLWVKSGTTYYRINFHYDKMLVNFENKVIYFKENYSRVVVE